MLQVSLLSLFAQHESWSKTVLPEDMKYNDYWPLTVQEVADRLATGKTIFIPGYILEEITVFKEAYAKNELQIFYARHNLKTL